ncbi:O-antigen polymerase [Photobacterium damselae]|uniref:O-antigen polymerase n=1 Tax=Photobacterium damselae TaxID=38293 RepID=UPI001EFD5313|nr:O-antigen polymerase [Photobacterium damselae]MCG9778640.1 oligosaccharide repeat unit polymerase [Photobacterium damselae]
MSVINIVFFSFYLMINRKNLGLIEAYSFNWFISFLSFEFFPYYLDFEIQPSVRTAYFSFFISCSLALCFLSKMKIKPFKNTVSYFISDEKTNDIKFLILCFWVCFGIVIATVFYRYQTGTLILGVDYKSNKNLLTVIIDYILMLIGFNHTGYWFYMGLFSFAIAIKIVGNKNFYLFLAMITMIFISAITTQKTYFLFSVIVLFIYLSIRKSSVLKQIYYGTILFSISTMLILLLNNIRYINKGNSGSIFDYFDFNTAIWYLNLRLDYARSSAEIINHQLIDIFSYIGEIFKSLLFFMPKSFLFPGEMYGVKIAHIINYSDNLKSGLSFLPYAHFYEMGGVLLVILLAVIMSFFYNYFSCMVKNKIIYIIYYIYMIPFVYYTSLTAPLHENIYTMLRASFSFVVFMFFCQIIYSIRKRYNYE